MIWEEKRGSPGAGFVMLKCFPPLMFPLFSFSLRASQANRLLRFDLLGAQEHTCRSGGEVMHAAHTGLEPLQRVLVILNHFLTSTFFSQWRNPFIFVTSCTHQQESQLTVQLIISHWFQVSVCSPAFLRCSPGWRQQPPVIKYHNVLTSSSASKEYERECRCGHFKGCQEDGAERIALSCQKPANEHNQGRSWRGY